MALTDVDAMKAVGVATVSAMRWWSGVESGTANGA
jgi:hypothetical protein